jgi:tetratricopeptide (TPR) repeat protein
MKSEVRHKLQTNYLADKAGHAIESTRPFAMWILLGVLALALVGVILGWIQSAAHQKSAVAWSEYFFASNDAKELSNIYEDNPGTIAGLWALQSEADMELSRGMDAVYMDRQQGDDTIKKAKSLYEKVLDKARDPMLLSRATLGLAQAYEAMGDIEKAVGEYKKVLGMDGTGTALAAELQRRVDWLQSKDSQQFYAWYREFHPTPSPPVSVPSDLNKLPTTPDLKFEPVVPSAAGPKDSPASAPGATPEVPQGTP